jgi:pyruvate formate lyase activating enzyme
MELVEHPEHFPIISMDQILDFLKERVGKLNGVAITGGEPLLNKDIEELLYPIKELGYPIKLDTNGFFPDMIEKLIDHKLVDMFAMDIKSGWTNYLKVSGVCTLNSSNNAEVNAPLEQSINTNYMGGKWKDNLKKSIEIIMTKAKDYEFRTTCVKGLHEESDFYEIKEMIKGAKKYFLQDYKAGPNMENLPFKPFLKEELNHFADIVRDNVGSVKIRGVD